uniref:Ephrin-A1 n=2 Tax=Anas platyrhynchos TaxID=8839 RepID=A0A8B9SZG2_ANAPL
EPRWRAEVWGAARWSQAGCPPPGESCSHLMAPQSFGDSRGADYTVEVRLNDYLDIICPHYEEGSVAPHAMERYTLYLVDLEEYQACKARSKEQIRWECDKPSALHGPEKFSEKFQRFTPFTLGKEFKEGHSYYYICECPGGCVPPAVGLGSLWGFSPSNSCLLPAAKPIHHHGETCLKLKVTVLAHRGWSPVGWPPPARGPPWPCTHTHGGLPCGHLGKAKDLSVLPGQPA